MTHNTSGKPDVSKVLRSVLSTMHNEIAPLIKEDYPKHRVELIEMLLARLIVELEADDDLAYRLELAAKLQAAERSSLPAALRRAIDKTQADLDVIEVSLDDLRGSMAAALLDAFVPFSAQAPAFNPVVHAIASAEHLVRSRKEQAFVAVRQVAGQTRTSNQELVISEQRLTDYLRRRMPERKSIRAANVRPVPGGRSKGTILFDMFDGDESQGLVIRKDFSKNFMGCSVADEYPIIRAAWESGVLVPKPLWLEEDPSVIEGQFIVFERVAGSPAGTMFEINATPLLVRQYAGEIAKLHAVDINTAGLASALQYGQSHFPVKQMILDSYDKHRRATPDDLLLESAHVWMLNNVNVAEQGAYFVHGDAGFHNVLAQGGRMTALLDWELAHAGDPAEDLMKCKAAASTVIPWSEFMEIYIANGGKPLNPARERFFTIWRMVSFSMFAAAGRQMFESGEDPDLRLAATGYNTFARLHEQLARELANAPLATS
jgi:aminoglycoside phosphotransferase (APT) family kinase protein